MDVIRELDHLNKLAKEDPTRRFNRLYRLLRQEQFLTLAKERISHNKGANTPGVDGQRMADITPEIVTQLSQELAAQTYQPQPVQRKYIPKRNSHKLRPLGLPSARDKIVQSGIALILEALYEPLFRPCSHGFRPGRSPITALRQISSAYRAGVTWIIEGDISDCFGNLPHQVILNCLRKRICDERFLNLISKLLRAGVMEQGYYAPTGSGQMTGYKCVHCDVSRSSRRFRRRNAGIDPGAGRFSWLRLLAANQSRPVQDTAASNESGYLGRFPGDESMPFHLP